MEQAAGRLIFGLAAKNPLNTPANMNTLTLVSLLAVVTLCLCHGGKRCGKLCFCVRLLWIWVKLKSHSLSLPQSTETSTKLNMQTRGFYAESMPSLCSGS